MSISSTSAAPSFRQAPARFKADDVLPTPPFLASIDTTMDAIFRVPSRELHSAIVELHGVQLVSADSSCWHETASRRRDSRTGTGGGRKLPASFARQWLVVLLAD